MAVNFPSSPINGQQFTANGITYEWNSALSLWEISLVTIPADVSELGDSQGLLSGGGSTGEGITAYTNTGDLPMTGVNTGAMAFVTSTNSLYIWNGSTWYSLSVVANTSPSLSGASPSYTLATDGTATVVTLTGTDTDGTPLTYSYSVTSGSLTNGGGETATVTQNGNVFTITPTTTDTYAGTFELTFTVSDGEASATASSSFTLQFAIPQQANTQGNTLLLTTSGSAGDNSAFTDSSSNALTITPSGTPSSQSFSPYRSGGYSVQLDGTSGWIDTGVADNFGTGDVTFECWVKTTGGGIMLAKYQGGSVMEAFQLSTAGGKMATHTASGTEGEIGTKDLRDNQWHHLVFERYNGTYYYYADGELQGTVANTENAAVGGNWIVGKHGTADIEWYDGQIRDLKLTVGTAVYGGSTPPVPTEPVTIDGSETLVLFTGIPYGKDLSPNNGTLTINGGVTFVPEGPYDYAVYDSATHGGSIYFDGSSYLQNGTAYGSIFDYSSSIPFTIDMWFYPTTSGTNLHIANNSAGSGDANLNWLFRQITDNTLRFVMIDQSGTVVTCDSTDLMNINAWNHVAVVMTGSSIKHWLNGAFQQEVSFSGSKQINGDVQIGKWDNTFYEGYIADFRWNVGEQVYTGTADITPPTEPLSSTNATLHVKGTDANIYDSTQSVKPVTLVGNTTASTTQTKYLSSSMYFDGTDDYINVDGLTANDALSAEFTIEMWLYPTDASSQQMIIGGSSGNLWVGMNIDGANRLAIGRVGASYDYVSYTWSANSWVHLAITRDSSNNLKFFVDGTQVGSTVTNSTTSYPLTTLDIGREDNQKYFAGYIEDLRLTKGLARYTEDFTVPTESLLTYTTQPETETPPPETETPPPATETAPQQANENTLLLTTSGSAGDNSAFTDSSSNALTITPAGTPSSQSFSPYRSGGYSTYHPGTIDDGFKFTSVTAPGSGDFTYECWIYATEASNDPIMETRNSNTAAGGFTITAYSDSSIRIWDTAARVTATGLDYIGKWTHVAVVKNGSTTTLYVDGTSQGTTTAFGTHNDDDLHIGYSPHYSDGFIGYISDFRYTTNAVYTSDFTPPTEKLDAIVGTQVLTSRLPYIADESINNYSVTKNGNTKTEPFGPYDYAAYDSATHGGSIYFEEGDFVTAADNTIFDVSGAYTAEAWIYVDTLPSENIGQAGQGFVMSRWDANGNQRSWGIFLGANGALGLYHSGNGDNNYNTAIASAGTITQSAWHHVAATWDGTTMRLFVDGNVVASRADANGPYSTPNAGVKLNALNASSTGTGIKQYITDARYIPNQALYTSDFTPPTEPLSSSGAAFHLVGTDANIYDSTQTVKPVTLVGNTTASTAESKYLSSSMYFDGTGDYVSLGTGSQFDFGTDDFTWEAWVYPNATNKSQNIFSVGDTNTTIRGMYYRYTNKFAFWANSTLYLESASTYSTGQWYHVAVVRSGNDFTLYVDGTSVDTSTQTASIGSSSEGAYIGTNYGLTPQQDWNGYIEDVRITKGLARYTANFTPPTESLLTYTPPPASYGDRGIIMGGMNSNTSTTVNTIQYFDITSTGDAANFGDLTAGRSGSGTVSNATLALNGGGYDNSAATSNVDYITIATTGNAANAGNLTYARFNLGAFSNGTRGVFCGGYTTSNDNTVDYVTIATSVTAADFGDSLVAMRLYGTASDNTYGIQAGGYAATYVNTIQYYTIDTADNATDFGDLTSAYYDKQGVYDLTYSVFAGGSPSTATIDYITTSTPSNASDFGDLLFANRFWLGSGCSNGTRGVFCGGGETSGVNVMQYITVSTPSDATDFGDMTAALIAPGCTSGNAS